SLPPDPPSPPARPPPPRAFPPAPPPASPSRFACSRISSPAPPAIAPARSAIFLPLDHPHSGSADNCSSLHFPTPLSLPTLFLPLPLLPSAHPRLRRADSSA